MNTRDGLARLVQSPADMHRTDERMLRHPIAIERIPRQEPSLGETLGHALDVAQRLAKDELRLLQVESHERIQQLGRRAAWLGIGALCLGVAWVAGWAAAVVALADHFPLAVRLGMLAGVQVVLGAGLVWAGLRDRSDR